MTHTIGKSSIGSTPTARPHGTHTHPQKNLHICKTIMYTLRVRCCTDTRKPTNHEQVRNPRSSKAQRHYEDVARATSRRHRLPGTRVLCASARSTHQQKPERNNLRCCCCPCCRAARRVHRMSTGFELGPFFVTVALAAICLILLITKGK